MTLAVSAPYRFVPLSRLVLLPDWADQVSHDMPFADGMCGELVLRLSAKTRLCVGGQQEAATDKAPGRVHFFRTPDGQPAIPGSSLKGMLRNVLEIAAFGRFRQVENQRLGLRDLSDSNNSYCQAIVRTPVRAGWLDFVGGRWQIRPCEFSRVHQKALIEALGIPHEQWIRLDTAPKRYGAIGACPGLRFERDERMPNNPNQWLAVPNPAGLLQGRIVVTGQPGSDYTKPKAKKFEFIFHDTDAAPLPVSPEVMSGFRQIHDGTPEWTFWSEKHSSGKLECGIPVFFHDNNGQVKSFGLAMMYKLPYAYSLHEVIRHTDPAHLDGSAPDLAELIFGYLEEGEHANGLRGRVNIGLASTLPREDGQPHRLSFTPPCILNGPKPTFYPAYIRQDGKKFVTLMDPGSELAGWKRYQVKDEETPELPAKAALNLKVQVQLETLPRDTQFVTRLRFHNLRRVELGALIWSLDFGGNSALRHAIGMGKPFGLGQLSIDIDLDASRLRPNHPDDPCSPTKDYLHACRQEFIDLMNQTLTAAGVSGTDPWKSSGPVKALLEYAKPASDTLRLGYLPDPKDFVTFRKTDWLDEVKTELHDFSGVTPVKGYDTLAARGYDSQFDANLERAAVAAERDRESQARDEQKKNASSEEAQLLDVEHLTGRFLAGSASKTDKKNLYNLYKDFSENKDGILERLGLEQQHRLLEQAKKLESEASDEKLMKAARKVLRAFQATKD